MFTMKRMTALFMSALLMGSTVCGPALAAEVTGQDSVSIQEAADQEEITETGEEPGVQEETSAEEASTEVATEESTKEPQNEPEDVSTDTEEPQEQGGEPEDAGEGTEEADNLEVTEEALPETEVSQEAAGKNATENAAAATTLEPEDEYIPIEIVDGLVDDTGDNAYDASSTWSAEKLASLPVLDTDVSSASGNCTMMGLPGEYIADQQTILDRINEIRKEACEEGVINPETKKPLTMADYVPLKWSRELEEIARIRAAETSMTADHKRTNGDSWQSVSSDYTYVGECAAWNYSTSVTMGISQWYNEKKYWLEGNAGKSGHYTTLIRPAMRYIGGGTFYSRYTEYPNTTLVEFYSDFAGSGLDESFVGTSGECIQKLEVLNSSLNSALSLTGTFTGVKGDQSKLLLTTGAVYSSSVFTAHTTGLLYQGGVSWSSSNTGIATVSNTGKVKAVKCGNATITAKAGGSSATAKFTVNHVLKKLPAVAATCTAAGKTEGEKCANCGTVTVKQESIPAKGHSYGSWKVTKKATCTAAGSREKSCTSCGNKVTEAIKATGHKWNTTYTVDKAATCTATGSESKHCSVCNASDKNTVRTIAKKAHTYGSWKVTKKATCTAAGSREKSCTSCGDKVTETIKATGHKWNTTYTVDKAATCTAKGSESKHCSVCNASDKSTARAIAKKAHTYGSWKVTKKATCTAAGSREKSCTSCGDKVTETIKATGHKWNTTYTVDKAATCTAEGSESKHCSVCNASDKSTARAIAKKAHTYGNWKVTKEATETQAGSREKTCKVCGSKVREEIPILKGTWIKNSNGWWYKWSNGSFPVSRFLKIGENTYYFKDNGYMATGWQKVDGSWYYFAPGGAMLTGWQKIGDKWYYLDPRHDGKMMTGWHQIGERVYYFNESGAMMTGWQRVYGEWRYFDGNGSMVTGWKKIGGKWYYLSPEDDGEMVIGFEKIDGRIYCFDASGAMVTGWIQNTGNWFYFEENGAMAANKWVGDYYLNDSGKMATNTWIGKYYVGADGKWIPGYKEN